MVGRTNNEALPGPTGKGFVGISGRAGGRTEQGQLAELFFSLPASKGFLLAGGAALAAQGLTHRPTQDLDFFTAQGQGDVTRARDEFTSAAQGRGWAVEHVIGTGTFCRLLVQGPEALLVDLALESTPACLPRRVSQARRVPRESSLAES
jgi:hypothetical protein